MNRIVLSPSLPTPDDALANAAAILRNGGAIVAPTDTVYGLFCNALDSEAVAKVVAIKKRQPEHAMPVAIAETAWAQRLARVFPVRAQRLAQRFWPGALTIVLSAVPGLPLPVSPDGRVGIRVPGHVLTVALLRAAAVPLIATSANLSGGPQPVSLDVVDAGVLERVGMVLDAGPLPAGAPSTVVDLTCDPPAMLRQGVIPRADVAETLGCEVI